jgi:putative nucleotidyltransferase with HDIG domain
VEKALSEMIGRIDALPSLPRLVNELAGVGDLDEVDLGWLSSRISLDPAISIRMLRLANSSFYGLPSRVGSIDQALPVLGIRNVQSMVMACAMLNAFANVPPVPGFDYYTFWRHSMATAVCARHLARRRGCDPGVCFTVGMLHEIGQLALCVVCPERYAEVLAHAGADDASLEAAERTILGFSHAEVGQRLASHWQFPAVVCHAVGSHHGNTGTAMEDRVGQLAAEANALAQALGFGPGSVADGPAAPPDSTAAVALLVALGYDEAAAESLAERARTDIDGLVKALLD